MFNYQFTRRAVKEIKSLPKEIQKQVFADIEEVCRSKYPLRSPNVLKLHGAYDADTFRLRSGSYRIIFRIINSSLVIDGVRHRQKGY
ncbi:MAG TPA: type II toxin-antitoxin system RelE/ParE family toxin [Candidatus Pacearchaeota archaeon]|nr:type II toxin-antitoxin system RelE/ParE family toxin [Candidatus Pacearchaeota archaeon]